MCWRTSLSENWQSVLVQVESESGKILDHHQVNVVVWLAKSWTSNIAAVKVSQNYVVRQLQIIAADIGTFQSVGTIALSITVQNFVLQ